MYKKTPKLKFGKVNSQGIPKMSVIWQKTKQKKVKKSKQTENLIPYTVPESSHKEENVKITLCSLESLLKDMDEASKNFNISKTNRYF